MEQKPYPVVPSLLLKMRSRTQQLLCYLCDKAIELRQML